MENWCSVCQKTKRKSRCAMILKFTLVWFLALRFDVRGEERQKTSGRRYCDFDSSRNYNATDLLRCIDRLVDQESGRSSGSHWQTSPREISFGSILTALFNESPLSSHQTSSFPAGTSNYYQSNYPSASTGTFDLSPGIRLNLFDALSSISRHDDYKCVPRILCEMAGGKLPGRGFGGQSGFLQNLGKNSFMEWLSAVDIAGSSPLLNFARAMILGYNSRGNSGACYRAFPRCPTDPGQLIHYLNNHNGGFFKFFNRVAGYRDPGALQSNQDINYPRPSLIAGLSREADRTGIGRINFRGQNFESSVQSIFPEDEQANANRVVFPDETQDRFPVIRISKYLQNLEANALQQPPFFPESAKDKRIRSFEFPASRSVSSKPDLYSADESVNEAV